MKIINLFLSKILFIVIGLVYMSLTSCNDENPVDNDIDNHNYGTMTDIEGNVYKTIIIGNQEWTVDNLKTTKYNNGEPISSITDSITWVNDTIGAYTTFNNTFDSEDIDKFGLLYNWFSVKTGKLAPEGWHVPSEDEWEVLCSYLIENGYNWDGSIKGNKIAKSLAAKTDWPSSEPNAQEGNISTNLSKNNSSGFSAIPGGQWMGGINPFDVPRNQYAWWWTSSEQCMECSNAKCVFLNYGRCDLANISHDKHIGKSIRLVKDY